MTNLFRKTITGVENVIVDQLGNNTVAFLADIPKNALVTSVLIAGRHIKQAYNPAINVSVEFPRDEDYNGKRVAAVLHSAFDGHKIVDSARAFKIESFVVEYIETAVAEV